MARQVQSGVCGLGEDRLRAIALGEEADPFAVLGMHRLGEGLVVRAFLPAAEAVFLVDAASGGEIAALARLRPEGVFGTGLRGRRTPFAYRLRLVQGGSSREIEDPYRFPPVLGDLDLHLLCEGRHWRSYACLGAHPRRIEGVDGTAFAVWAPNARRVALVGNFNDWNTRRHGMRLRHACGVWEIFLPGVGTGALYKYAITTRAGEVLLKADPYAMAAEPPPRTASVVLGLPARPEHPDAPVANGVDVPVSIYEVHVGSWQRSDDGRPLTYDALGDRLIPYARDLGFTHIELLPVFEHPFDGSWGYQPTALYAPTARFGPPDAFRRFVSRCHEAGIGVLMDWVPAHFPADAHALVRFDGTCLYEHEDPMLGRHPDWDTLIYNYGRREVANFLISNALFWLEEYGIDGLRVDAVASMLYLDYSREPGEWRPNRFGGRENLEAAAFLRLLNETVYGRTGGRVTIAEESTDWPMVSRPTWLGGLGFGYKWNMGWMHDTLRYMARDPVHRKFHHDDLTFGLLYAFDENFVLPLSHDEVVHQKGALLSRMPGDRWRKFANLRALFGLMFTHPGKKLLFMGGEFGQWREWDHDGSLDWHLLDDPAHAGLRTLVRDINRLYRSRPALHARDCEREGFEWIDCHDSDSGVLAFLRHGRTAGEFAAAVCNFTPVVRRGYRIGVPEGGGWREILNTDSTLYGGSDVGNLGRVEAEAIPSHGRPCSLSLTLPPLAVLVLEPECVLPLTLPSPRRGEGLSGAFPYPLPSGERAG